MSTIPNLRAMGGCVAISFQTTGSQHTYDPCQPQPGAFWYVSNNCLSEWLTFTYGGKLKDGEELNCSSRRGSCDPQWSFGVSHCCCCSRHHRHHRRHHRPLSWGRMNCPVLAAGHNGKGCDCSLGGHMDLG